MPDQGIAADERGELPVRNQVSRAFVGTVVQAGAINIHSSDATGKRFRRRVLTLVLAGVCAGALVTTLLTISTPSQAAPTKSCLVKMDPSVKSGYLWANLSQSRSYAPSDEYQCNSSGQVNTVRREETGQYLARFPGLGTDGGTVQVTSTDAADRICAVLEWGRSRENLRDEDVRITCVDRDGNPADATFTTAFLFNMGRSGPMAYVRADRPEAATYTPESTHQFNSTGGVNSIDREGQGSYVAFLPGLQKSLVENQAGGTVKVTPLGANPGVCNPRGWMPWRNPNTGKDFLVVRVNCYTPRGAPADAAFTLSYMVNLGSDEAAEVPGAYLWSTHDSNGVHILPREYQYNSTHTLNMLTRKAPGQYTVHLPGLTRAGGNPHASAYDSNATCTVTHWLPVDNELRADITCRAPNGIPVDTRFSFLYLQ